MSGIALDFTKSSPTVPGLYLIKQNTQKNEPMGKPLHIVFHHSAGHRNVVYDDYHFCGAEVDGKAYVVKTLKTSEKGQHLWGRNSGCVGYSLSAMAKTKANKFIHPSDAQLEQAGLWLGEYSAWKKFDIKGTVSLINKDYIPSTKTLVSMGTYEDYALVADHGYFALHDRYYPDRWDIGEFNYTEKQLQSGLLRKELLTVKPNQRRNTYLEDIISYGTKVFNELKAGKRKFQLSSILS